MAWFKAVAIAIREYGFKRVFGVLCILSAVYCIVELIIVRMRKERKGKPLPDRELRKFTKEQIITTIMMVVVGIVLLLWP